MKNILNICLMSMPCVLIAMNEENKPKIERSASGPLHINKSAEKTYISKSDGFDISDQGRSPDYWYNIYSDIKHERKTIYKRRIQCMQKAMKVEK